MIYVQQLFVKNLRFLRRKKGLSQLVLSERAGISPNYLNAVENGRNFPSPELIQRLSDCLEILPCQLFMEGQVPISPGNKAGDKDILIQEIIRLKQHFVAEIERIIEKFEGG